MHWKEQMRQVSNTEGLRGRQLVQRVLSTTHNSPNLPPQAYDGDDPSPLIARLTDEERREFHLPPRPPETKHVAATRAVQAQPILTIRVHVICGANDDGSGQRADPNVVAGWMSQSVEEANAIYAANGAGITFTFDKSDVELVKNTLVNQDFIVPADTNMKTGKDTKPLSDDKIKDLGKAHEDERNKVCGKYKGRCVLLLVEGTGLKYDEVSKIWKVGPRDGYAYSWEDKEFVNFPAVWGQLRGPEVSHESGHYLHLWHTHGAGPASTDEAAKLVKDYVSTHGNDTSIGLRVFDGDLGSGVTDTPPDPGPGFYAAMSGAAMDACLGTVAPQLTVDFGTSTKTYSFTTDRGDVMSYFKDCGNFQQHFSADQIKRMRDALINGNRRHLVGTQLGDTKYAHLRYSALWNQGTQAQVWWPLCTEQQVRDKTAELWGSMRLKEMHAVVLDGKVWYSCMWEAGTYGQVWWPNCSEQQFRDKTAELWKWARPFQVQGFVSGGQVRYSCIWNAGTHGQVWWPNCSEQQFRDKTAELWNTSRPAQMQAFVVNNQVRYSALWNAGTFGQVWWPNCSEQQFRDKTGEVWSWARPAQVQAFVSGGQVRYSALWNQGTKPQVWWPLCTEEQVRQKTDDLWSSMRPAQWYPVAV